MSFLPSSKSLFITKAANKDLASIARYTKKSWGEPQKKKYLSRLREIFNQLCEDSNLGKPCDYLYPNLCACTLDKHTIFYLEQGNRLNIVRILHQSMDIEAQFSKKQVSYPR